MLYLNPVMSEHQYTDDSTETQRLQTEEDDPQHGTTDMQVTRRKLHRPLKCCGTRCCERLVFISVILVLTVALTVELISGKISCSVGNQENEISQEQIQTEQEVYMDHSTSHLLPEYLRISVNISACTKPSCISCKGYVVPKLEPSSCSTDDNDGNIIQNVNGNYLRCKGQNFSYEDLLEKVKDNNRLIYCETGRLTVLTCCLLSQIRDENGHCACYPGEIHTFYSKTESEPVCYCPAGSQLKNCDKPYTQMGVCKCFLGTSKFCGQEQIIECESPEIRTNWTECRRTVLKQDVKYNCLCTKASDTDGDSDLQMC